jgi:hypothetical protein
MSRTVKGKKPIGYDYWTKRPYSSAGFGPKIKKLTHKKERAIANKELAKLKKKEDKNDI